jgi:tripartite-type tricarboxylate transporter receptor subunit TctC
MALLQGSDCHSLAVFLSMEVPDMGNRSLQGLQSVRPSKGMSRRRLLAAALAGAALSPAVQAQDNWPTRPVHLVLPFGAGATADAFARSLGPVMSESLGQPVVIENRAGAAGVIGSQYVARAAPDGYTLLVTFATHYSLPFMQKAVPYEPLKDFTPIIAGAKIQAVLAVHPSHPAKTMAEFVALAKAAPHPVQYGSGGMQLFGEMLAQAADIKMTHVAYKGGGPMMTDLLGGQITTGLTVLSSALPHVKAGRLRVLSVLTDKRTTVAPDVPAVTETVPDYRPMDTWVGVLGPAGLPPAVVERVHAEVRKALATPAVRAKLTDIGFEVTGDMSSKEFAESVRERVELYRSVTQAAGIVPE